jgi:hypothetical protein
MGHQRSGGEAFSALSRATLLPPSSTINIANTAKRRLTWSRKASSSAAAMIERSFSFSIGNGLHHRE